MATGVQSAWSVTAGSNGSADSAINFAEGQTPASLNNSSRAAMAGVKGFANQILGAKTTGGSANAQTYTSDAVATISAYAAGVGLVFKAGYSNSGACTLDVDGVGAKSIKKGGAQAALAANDIVAGGVYFVVYEASGDCFVLLNPESGQIAAQPLDATLTALAALSWSSGAPVVTFTAADTVSLSLSPSLTRMTLGMGTVGSPALNFGDADTGFYESIDDVLGVATAGTLRWYWSGTSFVSAGGALNAGNGSAAAPGLAFTNETDCGWFVIGTNNWGGSVGGSKFVDITGTLVDFSVPTRAKIPVSAETSGTLTAASANKKVKMSGDCTINDGVFAADDFILFENNSASTRQIIEDTGMTLRLNGSTTTGTRTVAVRGVALADFDTNAEAIILGNVT